MRRRKFITVTAVSSVGITFMPGFLKNNNLSGSKKFSVLSEDLERNFMQPPVNSRPFTYWMWMNGNITKEGITLDLEAMKRMGIKGALCFNGACGIPPGQVDYANDDWMNAVLHAVKEADRLGIEIALHNSPGYSATGGPWVTPEMSMQELVWTETLIKEKNTIDVVLPQPYAKQGYYRDAFVIAYPSLPVEKVLMKDTLLHLFLDEKEVDKQVIIDGNPETKLRLEPSEGKQASLGFEFSEPFEARAISITRKPEVPRDLFDGPRDQPPSLRLEKSDDGISFQQVCSVPMVELRAMDTPGSASFPATKSKFYRLVTNSPTWISEVELHNGPRLGGWPGKTNYTHGNSRGDTPDIEKELIIDPVSVIDISDKMDNKGHLIWNTGKNANWTILRIGHTTTGEIPFAHPDSGYGLVIDMFRKETLDFHFDKFLDKIVNRVKPYIGKTFIGFDTDSWEAGKQNWTVNFPEEFKNRRNYSIMNWMPALTGRIVGSIDDMERFLWDFRKAQTDLLAENYYGHFQELCHKRGLQYWAEPYGDGNLDAFKIGQFLDEPMAEFWTRYIYGSDAYSKQAASLAHIYGKSVASAEAFTGHPLTSRWTEYPYSLKAEADYFFTMGINKLVFHTFVHQPVTTGLPGMTMGPFGTHFDRNSTWTEQAYGWLDHVHRAQYLLQQGLPVIDFCYFKGDEPSSGIPGTGRMLPDGFGMDVCGPDAILTRFKIEKNNIILPDGMEYRICIMAPVNALLPQSINRIKELVAEGMILVISSKPASSLGLSSRDSEVQKAVEEMYGDLDGKAVTEHNWGKGKIFWEKPIGTIAEQLEISPDFSYTSFNQDAAIHYVHRVIGNTHLYFVTNHRRRSESIVCSFRVNNMIPEIWNSETGEIKLAAVYENVNGRMQVALEFEPAGALFIIFRNEAGQSALRLVTKDDKKLYTTQSYPLPNPKIYADIQNNFTVSLWAKPDTYVQNGRSMLFHPPQGETVYGSGHTAFGLSAGQNTVRIYERSTGQAREVLSSNQPVEGWTHLAVVYQQGTPSLFLNGKFAAKGRASGKIVHPGMRTPTSDDQFSSYFEGNNTPPVLYREILTPEQILQLFEKGLPEPELFTGIDIAPDADGILNALFRENGEYSFTNGQGRNKIVTIKDCCNENVEGPWKLSFPAGRGAPSEIELPSLISLHKHENFDVKHFSGTVIYYNTFTIAKSNIKPDHRIFLDLGRVEVVAEVKINGKDVRLLWKEPFIADITTAIRKGTNDLEIKVTNLWPNRLIGDEFLPAENDYTDQKNIMKLPEWYVKNLPKTGKRISFCTWHSYTSKDPLFESGLLGPVKILTAIYKTIES